MKRKLGLSALLPGFVSINSMGIDSPPEVSDPSLASGPLEKFIITPLNAETPIYLAGHRSHSSHSSHRSSSGGGHSSHASHRSSSGGGYSVPSKPVAPHSVPEKKADPLGQPQKPAYTSPSDTKINGEKNKLMRAEVVKHVQLSLMMLGYYKGNIDGIMGPETRKALLSYRVDRHLPIVDGIDVDVLNSLGIYAQ